MTFRRRSRPRTPQGCQGWLEIDDTWVHLRLRLCLGRGHVGCCDSSKNKHGNAHFGSSGHPVVQSFQPGESWRWCYVDDAIV